MRARSIKPGFFRNADLLECDPLTRILFAGLWCLADREGRLADRPRQIKIEVLPCDECDVDRMLAELQKRGFIVRYESGGARFIQVINFLPAPEPPRARTEIGVPCTGRAQCRHSAGTRRAQFRPC
ncbi:MAG: hypothetical protein AB9873_17830 [Syntrophobacteraceae bacterium]